MNNFIIEIIYIIINYTTVVIMNYAKAVKKTNKTLSELNPKIWKDRCPIDLQILIMSFVPSPYYLALMMIIKEIKMYFETDNFDQLVRLFFQSDFSKDQVRKLIYDLVFRKEYKYSIWEWADCDVICYYRILDDKQKYPLSIPSIGYNGKIAHYDYWTWKESCIKRYKKNLLDKSPWHHHCKIQLNKNMVHIHSCKYVLDFSRVITINDYDKYSTLGAAIASNVLGVISMSRY